MPQFGSNRDKKYGAVARIQAIDVLAPGFEPGSTG